MALTSDLLEFRYSAVSYLAAQSDPDASLGGYLSSTVAYEVQSSVTAAGTDALFTDNTQTSADHTGKWMVFVTGNNAIEARRIIYHDTGTGVMGFAPVWGTAPVNGEIYRISGVGHLFDAVTAAQCSVGHVDYRSLHCYNNGTGVVLDDFRLFLLPLDDNGVELDVAAGNAQKGSNPIGTVSVDTDEPDLDDSLGSDAFTSNKPQRFHHPNDYASAISTPLPGTSNINNLNNTGIWMRRTVPALHKRVDATAWLLVVEETGGVQSAMVITHDVLGFTPNFTSLVDRIPRTFGGSRVTATVLDTETEIPIEDESVTIAITSGPGTLVSDAQPLDTDVNGEAEAIYHSPEDDAQAGNSVTITATLGGDP